MDNILGEDTEFFQSLTREELLLYMDAVEAGLDAELNWHINDWNKERR